MKRRLLVLAFLLAACDGLTGPSLPKGAVRFEPPPRYQHWWDMVQACSGLTGDLRTVRWFHVPGASTLSDNPDLGSYNAIWYRHNNRIVLAGAVVNSGQVVRHEMLHALLQADGHPAAQYQTNCGGVVTCKFQCQQDGGGTFNPPSDTPVMRSDGFALELQIFPAANATARDGGATSIMLTATSPHAHPMWVAAYPLTYMVWLERQEGPEVIYGTTSTPHSLRVGFDTYGRRRYACDLELPAGTYLVYGSFDRTLADVVGYTVAR